MSRSIDLPRAGLLLLVTLTAAAVGCLGEDPRTEDESSDDAALSAGQCASAPSWAEGTAYATSAVVRYQGKVYKCLQGHTSLAGWTPAAVPALWQEQSCAGGGASTSSSSAASSSSSSSSGGGGSGGAGGSGGMGSQYAGTASYHAEYETIVTGAQVACAPDAYSVPDWDTRFDPKRLNYMVAALQATVYDSRGKGDVCYHCARVTATKTSATVTVRIIDRMTYAGSDQGKTRYLDLSPKAFKALGGTEAEGIIPIDFSFVACPADLQ